MLKKILIFSILLLVSVAVASVPFRTNAGVDTWSEQQFRDAFDEIARNFGAVEYSTYTFMIEFGRSPHSLDELRTSGHLNVVMANPYTGGDVLSLTREDYPDGDLAGNIFVHDRDEGRETHVEVWYFRYNDPGTLHSMVKRIWIYDSEPDREYLFGNDLPRDEQFTAVYCRQAIDALESFQQKVGESPESFDDMYQRGDVNVHYINPVTGELAVSSEELSAGDFMYRKVCDEGYTLIGWGRERPVFFATTDPEEELRFYAQYPELMEDDAEQ
jgi:hypothetical protein